MLLSGIDGFWSGIDGFWSGMGGRHRWLPVSDWSVTGGEGRNSRIAEVLAAGSYVVEARAFSSSAEGAYALDLAIVLVGDDEDADGLAAIAYGDTVQGAIFPAGDIDGWAFSGAAGEVVEIGLESADFDAFLVLYSGDGLEDRSEANVVEFNDDGGVGFNSRIATLVEPGTYLIEARPLSVGARWGAMCSSWR